MNQSMKSKEKKKEKSLLFIRLEETGVEIEKRGKIQNKVNPLERLFEKKKITRNELRAGKDYQFNHALANLSNHARPSYDSLSGGASGKLRNYERKDYQIRASAKILLAKTEISKKFGLLPILLNLFEKEKSVHWCEKNLGINHKVIESRAKEICNILENN
jgi:hypothetical protein